MASSVYGWIIIEQKLDDSTDFNLNWTDYRAGFGIPGGNFWIGLERMHQMTSTAPYRLRIEIQATCNNLWYSAEYDTFLIDNEALQYAIHVSGYIGDAGDSLQYTGVARWYHNGMKFTTKDRKNDNSVICNCAAFYQGGSWFNACNYFLLTGTNNEWDSLTSAVGLPSYQLCAARMMIKTIWNSLPVHHKELARNSSQWLKNFYYELLIGSQGHVIFLPNVSHAPMESINNWFAALDTNNSNAIVYVDFSIEHLTLLYMLSNYYVLH